MTDNPVATNAPCDALRRIHGTVRGRVQGVGFRAFTQRTAATLDLRGWVRNLRDGGVEFEATGPADRIDRFLALLRQGPRLAAVDTLDIASDEPHEGPLPEGFQIRF